VSDIYEEADWAAAQAGDGESFGRIFDRHRGRVFFHAKRLMTDDADADDVVAIVFLEAWRRRHDVRFVNGSMLPWLLVTATHAAANLARSTRRHRALLKRLPPGEHTPDHADAFGGIAETALAGMPLADRQVITLCVLEGFSEREAAQALAVAPGTVKSRLSRAKRRLADRFLLESLANSSAKGVQHEYRT